MSNYDSSDLRDGADELGTIGFFKKTHVLTDDGSNFNDRINIRISDQRLPRLNTFLNYGVYDFQLGIDIRINENINNFLYIETAIGERNYIRFVKKYDQERQPYLEHYYAALQQANIENEGMVRERKESIILNDKYLESYVIRGPLQTYVERFNNTSFVRSKSSFLLNVLEVLTPKGQPINSVIFKNDIVLENCVSGTFRETFLDSFDYRQQYFGND